MILGFIVFIISIVMMKTSGENKREIEYNMANARIIVLSSLRIHKYLLIFFLFFFFPNLREKRDVFIFFL